MNVVIIEDSQQERDQLQGYIEQFCSKENVYVQIVCYESGAAFLKGFKPNQYDLVFLDIYTDGSVNGMQVAKSIRAMDQNCRIVFSTGSKAYGVESYQVRAFDYLLKPYTYERLEKTLELCVKELKQYVNYIEMKVGRIRRKIRLADIIYTDYNNHYIQIHTKDEVLKSYMTFDEFAEMLGPFPSFLNCYRNCFVNMDKIVAMDDKDFILVNGERMPMQRKAKKEIKQAYADYVFYKMNGDSENEQNTEN
ncbi:MAG: LytR/AlgR family response regulator transcription factor [Blautia sp.]